MLEGLAGERRSLKQGGMRMKTRLLPIIFIIGLFFFLPAAISASMSIPLPLGGDQRLVVDLPLEGGTAYEISICLRTEIEGARAIMALRYRGEEGQAVDYKTAVHEFGSSGEWQDFTMVVSLPPADLKWELFIDSEQAGLYWWKSLKVSKKEDGPRRDDLAGKGEFYTGLVVDARHLPVQRGMSPRIYSESGQLIYGGVLASDEVVQNIGVVAYGTELTPDLLERLRLDQGYPYISPLMVEAIEAVEPARTGVVISEADMERILRAMAQYDFLARHAVIFLID